jgi:hypothetical protein
MARPQLHPLARMSLVNTIDEAMYKDAHAAQQRELFRIIRANSFVLDNPQPCLRFKGETFRYDDPKEPLPKPINYAHPNVRPNLKQYMKERDRLASERDLTLGYVKMILQETNYASELQALLPPPLHPAFKTVANNFFAGFGRLSPQDIQDIKEKHHRYLNLLCLPFVQRFITPKTP